ncbi:MAG: bifunctional adenosylcobinamide kinase/adenosylcobinamide-phosphate guanylyltransferase [Oribacterium sp.]|nr:bifunctional adenosylcobinamide kinase/adenosylcobinamide-phosphate guanylyltransferase [Oribacterium sp.]
MYYLVTGGAGSGKSEYAEELALSLVDKDDHLYYIATMYPYDDEETKRRIERHRNLRAGRGFVTIERPVEISKVLDEIKISGGVTTKDNSVQDTISLSYTCRNLKSSVVLLEDLTNLYANECYQTNGHPHEIIEPLRELSANVKALIVVTNELYCDGKQYPEETMGFLRELALINRSIAKDADKVFEVVAGIPVGVK